MAFLATSALAKLADSFGIEGATSEGARVPFMRTLVCASSLIAIAASIGAQAQVVSDGTAEEPAPKLSKDASPDEIYSSLFGSKQQTAASLPYPVIVSGLNQGDVTMTPNNAPGETLINRKSIVDLLLPFLIEEIQLELLERFSQQDQISTEQLNSLGLLAEFDHNNLLLNIDVPLEYRTVIPVRLQPRLNHRQLETVEQASTSAIVNMFAGTQYIHSSEYLQTGFAATQVNVDSAFNIKGYVLETGVRYSETTDQGVTLNDTRFSKDFVDKRVTVEAGDLTVPTSGLQGNPELLGLAGFRNFGLQPYEEYRTNPSQQFELQRSARVLVYVNGQFIREFRLQPGRYDLTDLPLQSAAGNDVVLEIQYDSGDTDRVVFSAFYDFSLLKEGTSDFAVSIGPTSQLEDGAREYDFDNPAISAFYRSGWTDRLTAGVNLQADTEVVNVGGEAFYSTGIGTFGLLGGYSDDDIGTGGALTGLYRWTDTDLQRRTRVDLQLRYQQEDYNALGGTAGVYEYDLAARVSGNPSKTTRLQFASGLRKRHGSSDFGQTHSANLTWQTRFGTLGTNLRFDDSDGREEWSAGFSFNVRLGGGYAQVYHDTRTPVTRASYTSRQNRGVGSLGWNTTYTHQSNSDELRTGATYVGNRFEIRGDQILGAATPQDDFGSENSTEISIGSAFVFADGAMAISRPVYDSFAIFAKNESVSGFEIAADPQAGLFDTSPKYAARSSVLGGAVVPDLNSYYIRTIEVEAPNAPAGTSLGGEALNFRPGYRSGHIVRLGNDRNVAVMAILVDENGEPVQYAAGYAVFENGERRQMFTNGGGRFYVDGLKHGERVKLEFDSPENTVAYFEVPDGDIGVIRIPQPIELQSEDDPAPYRVTMRVMEPERRLN
ncbi:MAG: hypothetical protein RIB03_12550 [Henriciella sp.]|uniref:hypothetical protein n=1 Tax=Henriciella sp. TaxID=1968823 RepID=UPI0032ECFC22